ncbi:MAG TPA: substrate-binding domain-containing protein [Candidatus Krumholzibacteriaceae bacterium]|jgi:tungstate transport system substrate-binding protein|nr:substrate-binding domain-containing protein [Candidatus Krumholzibacteriaceae bacterium]
MKSWQKMMIIAIVVTALIISGTLAYFQFSSRRRLLISTTTSLWDTGLLTQVEKAFEAKYPIDLQFTAVGTGVAIEQGRNGDVDGVLVHAPSQEYTFLQQGYGVDRKIIAYNFFTIVGPQDDPAKISGLNVTETLKAIAAYGRNQTAHPQQAKVWVSRGDGSGTHTKEQSLWKLAKFNYTQISVESWYATPGGAMGETLLKAEEFSAYTLSDIGTYLTYHDKNHLITLSSFLGGMENQNYDLLNVYSVMAVNQTRQHHVNFNDTILFIKFLISDEGQQIIENYGQTDFGSSGLLFRATVHLIAQNSSEQIAQWIRKYAFLGNPASECPSQYRDLHHPELYS